MTEPSPAFAPKQPRQKAASPAEGRSPGVELHAADRESFEAAFGADLSAVRIHADERAADSAAHAGANAYTIDHDIFFGAGRYAPATYAGRQLLAHELSHVIQQRRGAAAGTSAAGAEADADQASRAAVNGRPAIVTTATGIGLARQPADAPTASPDADLQNLQDEELESRYNALRAWLQEHPVNRSDATYEQAERELARLENVLYTRNPQQAARARRQQTEAQAIGVLSAAGGAVPGVPHPEIIPFLVELGAGMGERFEQLPRERITKQVMRYRDLPAADRFQFDWGFVKGFGTGVWEEIKGIGELIALPYTIIQWLVSKGPGLVRDWGALSGQASNVLQMIDAAGDKAAEEIAKAFANPAEAWRQLDGLFRRLVQTGLAKANEMGRQAADRMLGFLEQGTEEVGEGVGNVVGHLFFNAVLFVATDAIGNLVKEGLGVAGKLASAVVSGAGEALGAIARFLPKVIAVFKWLGGEVLQFMKDTMALLEEAIKALEGLVEAFRSRQLAEAVGSGGVRITVPLEEEAGAGSRTLMSSAEGKIPRGPTTTTVEELMGRGTERIPTGGSKVETVEKEIEAVESEHPEAPRVTAERAEIGSELSETWRKRIGSDKVEEVRVKQIERTPYGRAQTEAVTPAESTLAMEQEYVIKLRDGRTFQVDGMRPAGDGVLFQEHKTVESIWEQSYYSRTQARDKLRQMLINHRDIAFDLKPGCKGFFYTTNSPELRDLLTELIDSISPGERVLFPPE